MECCRASIGNSPSCANEGEWGWRSSVESAVVLSGSLLESLKSLRTLLAHDTPLTFPFSFLTFFTLPRRFVHCYHKQQGNMMLHSEINNTRITRLKTNKQYENSPTSVLVYQKLVLSHWLNQITRAMDSYFNWLWYTLDDTLPYDINYLLTRNQIHNLKMRGLCVTENLGIYGCTHYRVLFCIPLLST